MGNITFLGVEGSGKTVLTMALVNAFKAHEHEGWFLRPETRGAFRFLEQVPAELKEGTLPYQTTSLRHLAWSVIKDGEVQQTLDVLDYPGEVYRLAFLNAEDEADPIAFRERVQAYQEEINGLLGHLIQSEHIFVLFNLADSANLAGNAKNLDAVWVTNACLDYLHRLPHKPRITLLLTQIDKYVDLEQYELDPKVYLEHHLPLIYRNFQDVDVCAVAALGAADATYGIDSILLRSLFNSPSVQGVISCVQECRRNLKHCFEISVTSNQFCSQAIAAIMHLSCEDSYWQDALPWFIKATRLIAPNGLLDAKTCEECKMIIGDYYVVLQENRVNPMGHSKLLDFIRSVRPKTKEAALLIRAIYRSLQVSLQDSIQQQSAAVSKSQANLWNDSAVIFLVVTVVIVGVVLAFVLANA